MTLSKSITRSSERAHYLMQLGTYFTDLVDLEGVKFAFTKKLADIWYNQAYDFMFEPEGIDKAIKAVEEIHHEQDRVPCFYVHPYCTPSNLGQILRSQDYAVADEELWMFFRGEPERLPEVSSPVGITTVRDRETLDKFTHVYRLGLPGPEVEMYIQSIVDSYYYQASAAPITHYVAEYDHQPAAMMSVHLLGDYAGVYNIATVPEFRRRGLAGMLLRRLVLDAQKAGAKHIFLQTEGEGVGKKVFERMGFRTEYVRMAYVPKEEAGDLTHG